MSVLFAKREMDAEDAANIDAMEEEAGAARVDVADYPDESTPRKKRKRKLFNAFRLLRRHRRPKKRKKKKTWMKKKFYLITWRRE